MVETIIYTPKGTYMNSEELKSFHMDNRRPQRVKPRSERLKSKSKAKNARKARKVSRK